MPFRPTITTQIKLNNKNYSFPEHPAAKGMPYGQTGRRATVYQVQNVNDLHALKVFTNAFQTEQTETSAQRIRAFAKLPGLQVCSRTVLTRQNNQALVGQYPDLEYAALMPWVQGQTWQEIVLARQPLTSEQGLKLAHEFVTILVTMEEKGLAHCDLSGPNVLVSGLLQSFAGGNPKVTVNLVDVEDLFAPGLEKPAQIPGGSAGYGHKTAANGIWSTESDRFAGAVLLAEMLAWNDERIRRIAIGEQFFDPKEMQQGSDRFNLMKYSLEKRFGHRYAEAFTTAWFSHTLNDCPRLIEWMALLENGNSSQPSTKPKSQKTPELDDSGRYLFDSFKAKVAENNLSEAEKLVNALHALAPDFDEPSQILEQVRAIDTQEQARRNELACLDADLAEKKQIIQGLNVEIDAMLGRITKAEQDCVFIEGEIRKRKDQFSSSKVNTTIVIPKHQVQPSMPALPTRGPKKMELSVHEIFEHTGFLSRTLVEDAMFLPDGKGFVTIAQDKKAIIWTFERNQINLTQKISLQASPRFAAKSSTTGMLAIGDEDGMVTVWDLKDKVHSLEVTSFEMAREITALAFSSSGRTLAVGTLDGDVSLYSMETLSFQMGIVTPEVDALVFSPDEKYLVLGISSGLIRVLKTDDYSVIAETRVAENPSLAFGSRSQLLCCGDSRGMITLLDIPRLRTLLSFSPVEIAKISSIALSPNEELLATATENGNIYLWRTADGKLLATASEHRKPVYGLDFHPFGKYLFSGSFDGRAILWDLK